MHQAEPDGNESTRRELSLMRCERLVRCAIDCLGIESASRLSPHDRARLASAAAIVREICEALEQVRPSRHGPSANRPGPPDSSPGVGGPAGLNRDKPHRDRNQ